MFDIMNYAEKNHVEIDVRPGTNPVVWEFFIRDRQLDIVQFTQIHSRELDRQSNPDWYIEQRCESARPEPPVISPGLRVCNPESPAAVPV